MRVLALLILILSVPAFAQEDPPVKPDPAIVLNNEAVALLEKRKYRSAIEKLRSAIDMQKIAKGKADDVLKSNLVTGLLGQASADMARKDYNAADRLILEAKRLKGETPTTNAYQGILAYRRGYLASATSFLLDALKVDPKLAVAHEFLGMIRYKKEDLKSAIESWKLAIKHEPSRKKHLDRLIAKAQRELKVEQGMQTLRSTHFTCKFGQSQNRSVANEVLKMLEDAYSKIGAEFREYPKESLTAVLYADREFRGATNAQSWAAGIFDGKIRVPVRNFDKTRNSIRDTLVHEYTHFVVSKLTRRPPAWLNEGLAQYMEGADASRQLSFLQLAKEKGALRKMELLSASFATMQDAAMVRLAYAQSISFVQFLIDDYSMSRVVDVLRRMGRGLKPDQALRAVMGRNLAELEAIWKKRL